ncbi:MAG: hypothetical protein ACPGVU_03870 [Limisphaerales bacterium]
MATQVYQREPDRMPQVILWFLTAIVCLLAGWLLPVSYNSVHPVLLEFAGKEGPTIDTITKRLIDEKKTGPAELFVDLSTQLQLGEARQLGIALDQEREQNPAPFYWGGRDRQIEQLFSTNSYNEQTSLLVVFMNHEVRQMVYPYLRDSTLPGVQALMSTRDLDGYERFIAANKPGGLPLDATVVLTGLFYGSERLSQPLMQQIRSAAERAANGGNVKDLESIYSSVLVLGNRFNWVQLTEIMHVFQSTTELVRFAELVNREKQATASAEPNAAPGNKVPHLMMLAYCAILMSESADQVMAYLDQFQDQGAEDLRRAMGHGAPALQILLERQVPIASGPGGGIPFAAPLIIKWPLEMYILKYALFVFGAIAMVLGFSRMGRAPQASTVTGVPGSNLFGVQAQIPYADGSTPVPTRGLGGGFKFLLGGAFVVLLLGGLAFLTEPTLLKDLQREAPEGGYEFAGLSNSPVQPESDNTDKPTMDQSTIISIMMFGLLQILVYMICLMKIREIDLNPAPAAIKLRLMENEENLFDAGLYVGIAGTATALVLQVINVIEANLLAAYASNLFGIVCVAVVKIGHVRSFKRNLILQSQAEPAAATT